MGVARPRVIGFSAASMADNGISSLRLPGSRIAGSQPFATLRCTERVDEPHRFATADTDMAASDSETTGGVCIILGQSVNHAALATPRDSGGWVVASAAVAAIVRTQFRKTQNRLVTNRRQSFLGRIGNDRG